MSRLDNIKNRCTIEIAQDLVPQLASDILKIEFNKAIASEKPEARKILQYELDRLVPSLIKENLIPRLKTIQGMDDVTQKALPPFKKEATLKAANTILDFKLSSFATDSETKKRMLQIKESLLGEIKTELNKGKELSPELLKTVQDKAVILVTKTLIDHYLGKKYPSTAKILTATIDPNFINAIMDVEFTSSTSETGNSSKPINIPSLVDTLGQYIDEAFKYDPTIPDAIKDLQKQILAEIVAQKKSGKKPTFSLEQLLLNYKTHPAIKKIVLSQISRELKISFEKTFSEMENEELQQLKEPENKDLIKTKYANLRQLATHTSSAKVLEQMFNSDQGTKTLDLVMNKMLLPMIKGEDFSASDKTEITREIAKTLTLNKDHGSFSERFAAYNIQAELTADKRSRSKVVQGIMSMLGYNLNNYNWDNLRHTPSGKAALDYFCSQILLPSMSGQKVDMKHAKAVLKDYIKKGLKGE